MSGSTIVMAPAMDPAPGMTRSSSTPDLMSLPSWPFDGRKQTTESSFDVPSFDSDFDLDTSFHMNGNTKKTTGFRSQKNHTTLSRADEQEEPLRRARAGSLIDQPRRWFPSSKTAKEGVPERPTTSSGENGAESRQMESSRQPAVKPEGGLSLSKRSWSFGPRRSAITDSAMEKTPPPKSMDMPRGPELTLDPQVESIRQLEPVKPSPRSFSRATSYFNRMKQKKLVTPPESDSSSAISATDVSNVTTETRFSQSTSCESSTIATTEEATDAAPQNADPLWSSFKSMEIEFKTFTTKSTPKRVATVQGVVNPFLRRTANHPSTKKLAPEDIDRRVQVLKLWWTEILEMLDGTSSVSVPGVDRPPMYDALSLIMTRHEWRQTTVQFMPLVERERRERQKAASLTETSDSNDSVDEATLLAETAEHNVRTIFVSSLVKQLAFVVEKLSMRNAAASLLRFSGLTCAYACFFVPGVADILFRHWEVNQDLIRRTADVLNLPRKAAPASEDLLDGFPPAMRGWGWQSPQAAWSFLKQTVIPPIMIAGIPWVGQWVARWKAKDTDIFFSFCKHFHILADGFTPANLSQVEKAKSPGMVMVQSQLLAAMDATVHRLSTTPCANPPGGVDGMPGSDSALSMPLSPADMMKGMSENRLVLLLKDLLLDETIESSTVKHLFASSYGGLLKAAVRRTSLYNGPACFTLSDLIEEVVMTYDEYERSVDTDQYIDWDFWLSVFKKMLTSWNTVTEVRVFSSIYTLWDVIARNPSRKTTFCLDWLLTEEVFNAFFNHWCPMVRAYYQRLLCWRMCRCVGEANDVDATIYSVAAARLKTTWTHYLYLLHSAEVEGRFPPSSAPVVPTPGKKFMIIRQEVNQPQPGLFVNFDSMKAGLGDLSMNESLSGVEASLLKNEPKKKWGFFNKVFSMGGSTTPPKSLSKNRSWDEDEFVNVRRETAESRTRQSGLPKITIPSRTSESDSSCSSPVMDEPKYIFRFILSFQQPMSPARDRVLKLPHLPAPAQAVVDPRSPASRAAKKQTNPQAPEAASTEVDGSVVLKLDTSPASVDDGAWEFVAQPLKPTGFYAQNAVYTGRALAEWASVVMECNSFVLRRREEGISTLKDVEIPTLGIESFRRPGC